MVDASIPPECPRCGYDVSGVMSMWNTECPLRGKCSECGYEFQWSDVLGPMRGVPPWFFETAKKRVVRSAISTSVRTLAPWWFWKRVPRDVPVSWGRLIALVLVSVLVVYAAGVVGSAMWGVSGSTPVKFATDVRQRFRSSIAWLRPGDTIGAMVLMQFVSVAFVGVVAVGLGCVRGGPQPMAARALRGVAYLWVVNAVLTALWLTAVGLLSVYAVFFGGVPAVVSSVLFKGASMAWPAGMVVWVWLWFRRHERVGYPFPMALCVTLCAIAASVGIFLEQVELWFAVVFS